MLNLNLLAELVISFGIYRPDYTNTLCFTTYCLLPTTWHYAYGDSISAVV